MLSDLIIYACLASDPSVCERRVIPSDRPVVACIVAAPMIAAEWSKAWPKLRIKRIMCRDHMADA